MSKAVESIAQHEMWSLSRDQIEVLADKLFSKAVSKTCVISPADRRDLVTASRAWRRLLQSCERASGRTLGTIFLDGVTCCTGIAAAFSSAWSFIDGDAMAALAVMSLGMAVISTTGS